MDHAPLDFRRVDFVVMAVHGSPETAASVKEIQARMREEFHIVVCDKWCGGTQHQDPLAGKNWETHHYEMLVDVMSDVDWWWTTWSNYKARAFVLWAPCEPGDTCF
jgi:hypothetical protein